MQKALEWHSKSLSRTGSPLFLPGVQKALEWQNHLCQVNLGTLLLSVASEIPLRRDSTGTSRQEKPLEEDPITTETPVPVGYLSQDHIEQYDLSPTLPWIGHTPAQYNSRIPRHLEDQALDALLNPAQFEDLDATKIFSISNPRSTMALSAVSNAKM